ncbi:MAG: methyl-accepting chemotaxis protein [Thermodesulfovibrionales bacterium]
MLLKQRLRINMVVSTMSVIAVLVVFFLTISRISRAIEASKIADGIITTAFERVTLRTDYMRTGGERAREQVTSKQRYIVELLKAASEKFTDPEDKEIIAELVKNNESIGKIFRTIVENHEKRGSSAHQDALFQEVEDRLLSQLNMRVYDTVLLGSKLQESGNETVTSALRLAAGGICFVLLLAGAVTLINSWTMDRAITARIRRLRDGAMVIGGGNLDYRIDVGGNDEFADLAEAYNAMTSKLRSTYQHLEKEIYEHTQAEEALQSLNAELEQRVFVQTAEVIRAKESLEEHVAERTSELQTANESLYASQRAALNLMEDALSARRQAEQITETLQREVTERKQAERIVRQSAQELLAKNEELDRFNSAMVAREIRMVELKRQVNELCIQAGNPPRYSLDFGEEK